MPRLVLAAASFAVTLGAIAVLRAWPLGDDGAAVSLAPGDSAVVAQGAAIYASECAGCHGTSLEGQPNWRERREDGKPPAPPHDESGHNWHHPDSQLFAIVKNGLPKEIAGKPYPTDMPAFGNRLADAQILAVLSYIKSRWPAEIRSQHDAMNERLAAAAPVSPQ